MFNINTLRFLKTLENMAELSANGILPFSEATGKNYNTCLFYDDTQKDNLGYLVVEDTLVMQDHHDIVSYYDKEAQCTIRAVVHTTDGPRSKNMKPIIEIRSVDKDTTGGPRWIICIHDGMWYFC